MKDARIPVQDEAGGTLPDPLVDLTELMAGPVDVAQVSAHVVGTCAELPGVEGAALLLAGEALRLYPAARAGAVLLDRADLRFPHQGPTEEVLCTGQGSDVPVAATGGRWPLWARLMTELGIARVTCVPLRLVDRVVGGLELYSRGEEPLSPSTRHLARGLCGLVCVALRHEDELSARGEQVRQLSDALERRVAIEQAKGYLRARGFADPEGAFHLLRQYARRTRRSVDAVSRDVVDGRLGAESLVAASRRRD